MLSLIDRGWFSLCVSVPLVLEYESAAKRQARTAGLTFGDIDDIIDYVCHVAEHYRIYYLWRPTLKDPQDDMVLELAVTSAADVIVTYNKADFAGADRFGVKLLTPKELLEQIGELK
jgi:predicted nucleic acid-binding protein